MEKTAGLLLYALQTASANLRRTNFEHFNANEIVLDPRQAAETPLGAHVWEDEDFEEDEEEYEDEDEELDEAEDTEEQEEDEAIAKAAAAAKKKEVKPAHAVADYKVNGNGAIISARPASSSAG